MRVLHIVKDFRRSGGIGTYLYELVEAQLRLGHEVRILARTSDGSELVVATGEGFEPDVVHAHDHWRPSTPITVPLVQSLHNYDFGCSSRTRYLGAGEPCLRSHGLPCIAHWASCSHSIRLDRRIHDYSQTTRDLATTRAADAVVVYSNFVAETARVNGIDGDRVFVFPCPMPRFETRADIPHDQITPGAFAYFGRLSKPKGVDVLIDALATVSGATLRVVGDGYHRGELEEHAARVAPGRVEFFGWSSPQDLPRLYAEAYCVVMPGRWPEPFGIVGLESAWAGRPVISSDSGGVSEWLRDDMTGLVTRPGDAESLALAMGALLRDPDRAISMGREARRLAESWPTAEKHALDLGDLYGSLLGR